MDSETARVEDSCVNGGASSNSAPVAAPAPGTSTVNEMLYLISLYLSEHTPCSGLSTQIVSELVRSCRPRILYVEYMFTLVSCL